jgi:hypothetical protein
MTTRKITILFISVYPLEHLSYSRSFCFCFGVAPQIMFLYSSLKQCCLCISMEQHLWRQKQYSCVVSLDAKIEDANQKVTFRSQPLE